MHCGLCVVFSLRANLIDSMRHSSDCVAYAIKWGAGLMMSRCMFRFISFNSPTLVRSKSLFHFFKYLFDQLCLRTAAFEIRAANSGTLASASDARAIRELVRSNIPRGDQSLSVLRDSARGLLWIIRVHLGRLSIVWIRSCGKASHQITKYLNDCNLPPWILKNGSFYLPEILQLELVCNRNRLSKLYFDIFHIYPNY